MTVKWQRSPVKPDVNQVLQQLHRLADPSVRESMKRFGINARQACGISTPLLRAMARELGSNHRLALQLWDSGLHEARILSTMIDDPGKVSETQMERWARDFDSWGLCDGCCCNLFDRTPAAFRKARQWSSRPEEYVRRAGFALMACLAVHDKTSPDSRFESFFQDIERESDDPRKLVRQGVNWALRQIGKRSSPLNRKAITVAKRIRSRATPAATWIARDALRELTSEKIRARLK